MKTDIIKLTATMAKAAALLTDNQKEANAMKVRLLKAGLGRSGLMMPENWDSLPEDEKQRRLDKAIEFGLESL